MIKNIYTKFLSKNRFISKKNLNLNYFSTKLNPEKSRLEDYEYVQQISKQIKNNDINKALQYLIQSHLNNQILNKQIYYSLQQKMQELSATTGYHEILYKLYRQNFQPNSMTLKWMNRIAKTQNNKLGEILKQDFQKLNQSFPLNHHESTENVKAQISSIQSQKVQEQIKPQGSGRKSRKVPTIPTTDDYFSKTPETIMVTKKQNQHNHFNDKPKKLQKQPTKQQIEIESIAQIQELIQNMFKQYGKITLHNVQLELDDNVNENFDMDEQINGMYNDNQTFDPEDHQDIQGQEQTMEDYVLQMLSSISKIKIGKIQLQSPHFLQEIKRKLDDHKNDDNKPQH